MNNTESFGNLDRREFLTVAEGAAVVFGSGGCFSLKRRNVPIEAAMRKYVDDKLFGGIVCASNRGDLACVGLRTLSPAGGTMIFSSRRATIGMGSVAASAGT